MTHTHDFLAQIRDSAVLRPSTYALAKHMRLNYGWGRQTTANYVNGFTFPNESHALDIAAELGLDPAYVLSCIAADRSRDAVVSSRWEAVAERLRGTAAAVIMSALLSLVSAGGMLAPSQAYANASAGFSDFTGYTLRALLERAARALRDAADEAAEAVGAFFAGLTFGQ